MIAALRSTDLLGRPACAARRVAGGAGKTGRAVRPGTGSAGGRPAGVPGRRRAPRARPHRIAVVTLWSVVLLLAAVATLLTT